MHPFVFSPSQKICRHEASRRGIVLLIYIPAPAEPSEEVYVQTADPTGGPRAPLLLQQHPVERLAFDLSAAHGRAHVPPEAISVRHEVVGGLLVQRVRSVGLEEEELQAHDDGVEVEDGLPVFAQDVEADFAFEVDVWVVDFLFALDFWRLVGEVLADGEGEVKLASFVETLVGSNGEGEVEDVVGVGEGGLHRARQREF